MSVRSMSVVSLLAFPCLLVLFGACCPAGYLQSQHRENGMRVDAGCPLSGVLGWWGRVRPHVRHLARAVVRRPRLLVLAWSLGWWPSGCGCPPTNAHVPARPDCVDVDANVRACAYVAGPRACDLAFGLGPSVRCASLDEDVGRRLDADRQVYLGRPYLRADSQLPADAYCPALGPPYHDAPPSTPREGAWYAAGGAGLPDGAFTAWVAGRTFPCFGFDRALDGGTANDAVVAALPALLRARQLCCAYGPADADPR